MLHGFQSLGLQWELLGFVGYHLYSTIFLIGKIVNTPGSCVKSLLYPSKEIIGPFRKIPEWRRHTHKESIDYWGCQHICARSPTSPHPRDHSGVGWNPEAESCVGRSFPLRIRPRGLDEGLGNAPPGRWLRLLQGTGRSQRLKSRAWGMS